MHCQFVLAIVVLIHISFAWAGFFGSSSETTQEELQASASAPPNRRYDYKLSFKEPLFYNDTIPFWTLDGDAIPSDKFIRLSPSVPNTKGRLWSELANPNPEWMVDVTFQVKKRHPQGGRGLAFWYTKDVMPEGPVFGVQDQWQGLAIWLDTANPKTRTSMVIALVNDGTKAFTAGLDPTQYMLGSCDFDFSNTGVHAILRVSFVGQTLKVELDTIGSGANFQECIKANNVPLQPGYHFGLSAASGQFANDHDIFSWETWEMNPAGKFNHPKRPLEEQKLNEGQGFIGLNSDQKMNIKWAEEFVGNARSKSQDDEKFEKQTEPDRQVLDKLHHLLVTNDKSLTDLAKVVEQMSVQFLRKQDDQDGQITELVEKLVRVERLLVALDNRLSTQLINMHTTFTKVTKETAATKGTMSTLLSYIFYFLIAQFVTGVIAYVYWKLRVQDNQKKFM